MPASSTEADSPSHVPIWLEGVPPIASVLRYGAEGLTRN
jgi:hypothetical protein